MSNEASPQFLFGFGGAAVCLGLVILAVEPRWVDATGTVTAVHVNDTEGRMSGGYRPYVKYRYEIDGKEYRQDSVWCAPPAIGTRISREDALRDAEQLQPGALVPIRYAASSPEEVTCLVEGGSEYFYLGLGPLLIGAFLLLAGAHGLVQARR